MPTAAAPDRAVASEKPGPVEGVRNGVNAATSRVAAVIHAEEAVELLIVPVVRGIGIGDDLSEDAMLRFHTHNGCGDLREILQLRRAVGPAVRSIGNAAGGERGKRRKFADSGEIRADKGVFESF